MLIIQQFSEKPRTKLPLVFFSETLLNKTFICLETDTINTEGPLLIFRGNIQILQIVSFIILYFNKIQFKKDNYVNFLLFIKMKFCFFLVEKDFEKKKKQSNKLLEINFLLFYSKQTNSCSEHTQSSQTWNWVN